MKALWRSRNFLAGLVVCGLLCAHSLFSASLSVNGTGSYVSVPADSSLTPTNQFTLEAWVKVSGTGLQTIVSRGDGDNGSITDYILQLSNDGAGMGNEVSLFAGDAWDASTSSIPLNTWTHVAVTYDGSNKLFYINGVLDRLAPRTNSIYSTPTSPLYIGRQGSGCDCNFFNGSIAEVRIWNTIRTSNQIEADMNFSFWGKQPGLVAYYHLNEGGGTTANDITGNGHAGTLTSASWAQTAPPSLGTITAVEGPSAGADSVALSSSGAGWTDRTNAPWLHLSTSNQSGTGSTNIIFSFDANTGATRTGTLTVAGINLTVTQAGTNYVAVSAATALPFPSSILPYGVAVDGAGNVYIADDFDYTIKEWVVTNNTVLTLVSSGLDAPYGVALDGAGNVYIDDTFNSAIKEWLATNGNVISLISSGLNDPFGVAVDGAGNVYLDDSYNYAIKELSVANHLVSTLTNNLFLPPFGIAVDGADNIYYSIGEVLEISPPPNTPTLTSGFFAGSALALDGAGNIYAIDSGGAVQEMSATTQAVTNIISTGTSWGVAVDSAGNLYAGDNKNRDIVELPRAFVIPTIKYETLAAGNDALSPVVPATANLQPPFASFPWTDPINPPWLTITSVSNGVVNFSFQSSTTNRTGNIILLGQTIPVMQFNDMLNTNEIDVGPAAGTNDVVLTVNPAATQAWTASSQASWLHLNTSSGSGGATLNFTFDANQGSQRTGTLTIAGQTLTVVQAAGASNIPSILSEPQVLGDGSFQFSFTNIPGASFTVLFSTNPALPLTLWTPIGVPTESPPGQYQFTGTTATNGQGFYNVRSP